MKKKMMFVAGILSAAIMQNIATDAQSNMMPKNIKFPIPGFGLHIPDQRCEITDIRI